MIKITYTAWCFIYDTVITCLTRIKCDIIFINEWSNSSNKHWCTIIVTTTFSRHTIHCCPIRTSPTILISNGRNTRSGISCYTKIFCWFFCYTGIMRGSALACSNSSTTIHGCPIRTCPIPRTSSSYERGSISSSAKNSTRRSSTESGSTCCSTWSLGRSSPIATNPPICSNTGEKSTSRAFFKDFYL